MDRRVGAEGRIILTTVEQAVPIIKLQGRKDHIKYFRHYQRETTHALRLKSQPNRRLGKPRISLTSGGQVRKQTRRDFFFLFAEPEEK